MDLNNEISGAQRLPVYYRQADAGPMGKKVSEQRPDDRIELKGAGNSPPIEMLGKMKELKGSLDTSQSAAIEDLSFSYPALTQAAARNNAPVVVVHGTLRDRESIKKYNEASLAEGHPTEFSTYLSIKEGERLEESAKLISDDINEARKDIARRNLETLNGYNGNPEKIAGFFQMDPALYGKTDTGAEKLAGLLPDVTKKMDGIMALDDTTLRESLSTRLRDFEGELAASIEDTGFASSIRDRHKKREVIEKCAAEIIESIAPKAFLVGHSMGGFVSYLIGINPRQSLDDRSSFSYDAGNGVSTIMVLSSPVGKGLRYPLPTALATAGYDIYEKNVLEPTEDILAMQIALTNPFFGAWYAANKAILKEATRQMTEAQAAVLNPCIYAQKPGYEQITEGSSFIKEHVEGRKIPPGLTVIAVTNEFDGVSEPDRSRVDERQPNGHNLDAEVTIRPEDLKDPMVTLPRVAHFKMADYPAGHWGELKKKIVENPRYIPRILDRKNHDGFRYNSLVVLLNRVIEDRSFFDRPEMKASLRAIRDVAEERLPFKDSPSYVASQIVSVVDNNTPVQKPNEGNWVLTDIPSLPINEMPRPDMGSFLAGHLPISMEEAADSMKWILPEPPQHK